MGGSIKDTFFLLERLMIEQGDTIIDYPGWSLPAGCTGGLPNTRSFPGRDPLADAL